MHLHMEQSFSHSRNQKQDVTLGWTQASFLPGETSIAPSNSASSAVISPASGHCGDSPSHSLGHSGTSLKERDYIGLAEVTSAPPPLNEPERDYELNFPETDLCLGLGLSTDISTDSIVDRKDRVALVDAHAMDVVLCIREEAQSPFSSTRQSLPSKSLVDAMASAHAASGHQSSLQLALSKNGGKRLYAEAMADSNLDSKPIVNVSSAAGLFNTIEPRSSVNHIISVRQSQDSELKSYLQGICKAASHVVPWQCQNDPGSSFYRSMPSQSCKAFSIAAIGEGDNDVLCKSKLDLKFRNDLTNLRSVGCQEEVHDEAPPAKGQVVGWPPLRSYRRSTLAARPKAVREEGGGQSTIYVKVNMDGIPIGRKVDLSIYKSYDGLLSALEDMFHNPNGGFGAQFLKGSEFVLTYEDKEGDWMLVGDVPWSMFINTVRRLRITRSPDMACLGSRTATCHA
ncbi:hypothetical protein L7F22_024275 [Adiantum nelumboides]|nr:hypothetical protein [Adiantum nelumboides]